MSYTLLFLLLLSSYVSQCSPQSDTSSATSFTFPSFGSAPIPPPAFPNWNSLFSLSEAIAALPQTTINKVNVSFFNYCLKSSDHLDVNSVCLPSNATPTIPSSSSSPTIAIPTTLTRTSQTSSPRNGTLTTSTMTSSMTSHTNYTSVPFTTRDSSVPLKLAIENKKMKEKIDLQMSSSTEIVLTPRSEDLVAGGTADLNLVAIVVPIVLVTVVCIIIFIVCFAHRIYGRSQHVNFCKDLIMCRWRRNKCVDVIQTTNACKSASVTFDNGMAGKRVRPTPARGPSTNSTTHLIRSFSAGESSTDDVQIEIRPELAVQKSFHQPVLEPVGESLEPVPCSSPSTDPTHRRAVGDLAWQRTLPWTSKQVSRDTTIVPQTTRHNLNEDLGSHGVDNVVFQPDCDVKFEISLTDNDDEDDELTKSAWEKFDEAENTAVEVEMGSQLIADLNKAPVTSSQPVQATSNEILVELI